MTIPSPLWSRYAVLPEVAKAVMRLKALIYSPILELHRTKRNRATDLLEGTEMSGRLSEEELIGLIRG